MMRPYIAKENTVTPSLTFTSILGNHIMWIALLSFLLGLVILFNPVATSVFVVYVVAFAFLVAGFTYIINAFRK